MKHKTARHFWKFQKKVFVNRSTDHVSATIIFSNVVILKVDSFSGLLVGQAFFFPLAAQVADLTACIFLISVME